VHEGRLEREGVGLHYLEWRPAGPPREPSLLLLHGLSSNARIWERMAALLPGRRIVALDQRSHGLSDRPDSGHTLDDVTADAAHAIRELGLGRPLVVGHSWGAAVALALASAQPELAGGLVVVDGGTSSFSRFMTWEDAAARMQPPLPTYRDAEEAAAARAADLEQAWADDLMAFVRAGLVEVPTEGFTSTLTAAARLEILRDLYDFQPELLFAEVQGPILLAMAGQTWPGAPPEFAERRRRSAEEVLELRPDAQLRWYDSRHDVPLIRPLELAADVELALDEVDGFIAIGADGKVTVYSGKVDLGTGVRTALAQLVRPAELAADVERTAIATAFRAVARDAGALAANPALDWRRPAHGDGDGWDARQLLAHLSSTQAALPAIIAASPPPPQGDGAGGDGRPAFDPNRWNESQQRRRAERRPSELAYELVRGAEGVHAALMDADLAAETGLGRFAGLPLGEGMEAMLRHQRAHLADLGSALS